MLNEAMEYELAVWAEGGQVESMEFVEGYLFANDMADILPDMSAAQAAVATTLCMTGGWDVTAFKPATIGSLLACGLVVVYKGMAYTIDVWEGGHNV